MDLIPAFAAFLLTMVLSLVCSFSMVIPLLVGLLGFALVGIRRGRRPSALLKMCLLGMRDALPVALVMLLIGCLTSLWRQSGTIAYFTYYGMKLIPPSVFILSAFLLTALMSYALGTSFGVAGTIGVILMTVARASGVSLPLAGGAVMSGLYFGDRGSPVASSATLVAAQTHTELSRNLRAMLRTSLLPMLLSTLLYALLSPLGRPTHMDVQLLTYFEAEFRLTPLCLLPTLALLIPALLGMKVRLLMLINIVLSIALTALVQGRALGEILLMMLSGYIPGAEELVPILSGGGVRSMLEVVALLLLSSGCAGIFEGTGMFASVENAFARLSERVGRFPAMVAAGILSCMVFCNQTIGVIMSRQCMFKAYPPSEEGRFEMMLDIENSVIVLAGLVPWCIACSVPLTMLGCGYGALPLSFYLWLLPLSWFFIKQRSTRRMN